MTSLMSSKSSANLTTYAFKSLSSTKHKPYKYQTNIYQRPHNPSIVTDNLLKPKVLMTPVVGNDVLIQDLH